MTIDHLLGEIRVYRRLADQRKQLGADESNERHSKTIRKARDAHHPAYTEFNLGVQPDFHGCFANEGIGL